MPKPRHRIAVHPPAPAGGRRVSVDAESLGVAIDVADLREFLRRAGLDPEDVRLDDPAIEWRGGGPDVWSIATE